MTQSTFAFVIGLSLISFPVAVLAGAIMRSWKPFRIVGYIVLALGLSPTIAEMLAPTANEILERANSLRGEYYIGLTSRALFGLLPGLILVSIGGLHSTRSSKQGPAVIRPAYDSTKWMALVASDPDVADGVKKLRPYGEQYVTELASTLLGSGEKQDPLPVVETLLFKAKADAELAAEDARLDFIGRNVDAVFQSSRGRVARLIDGRALAETGKNFRLLDSLEDCREFYRDQEVWHEVTILTEKRRFYVAAHASLESVNASLDHAK